MFNSDQIQIVLEEMVFKVSNIGNIKYTDHNPVGHNFDGSICVSYFFRKSSSDKLYQIILNSDHQFKSRFFKFVLLL